MDKDFEPFLENVLATWNYYFKNSLINFIA